MTYSSAIQKLKHLLIFTSDVLSDHMLVIADLQVNIQKKYPKQSITYRNAKNIDLDKFNLDIQKSNLIKDLQHSVSKLYHKLNKTL